MRLRANRMPVQSSRCPDARPHFRPLLRRPRRRRRRRRRPGADADRRPRGAAPGDPRRPAAAVARRAARAARARARAPPLAHPGAGLRRRDRPVHAVHPARVGEPLLPRARCCTAPVGSATRCARRRPRSSRGARTAPAGAPADRARRPAHPHRRPGGPPGARLHALRDAAAARRAHRRAGRRRRRRRGDLDGRGAVGSAALDGRRPRRVPRRVPSGRHFDDVGRRRQLGGRGRRRRLLRARARAAHAQRRDGAPRRRGRRRAPARLRRPHDRASPRRRRPARCPTS